jgi:hypothetical protein
VTRPPTFVVEIERVVLDGLALDTAGIDALRAALAAEIGAWAAQIDAETLRSSAHSRLTPAPLTIASTSDARGVGRGIGRAVLDAVDAPARRNLGEGPARRSLGEGPARRSLGEGPARRSLGEGGDR